MNTIQESDRHEFISNFKNALEDRELLVKKNSPNMDYSKGFSGTKADTDTEKDFAKVLLNGTSLNDDGQYFSHFPILRPPIIKHPEEETALRKCGVWVRYLGASGCYMYCHNLTRAIVSVRPEDYIETDENLNDKNNAEEVRDPANGLLSCALVDLPATIEQLRASGNNKTPLILDGTKENLCLTFYSMKAMLADVSQLVVPYAISGLKRTDLMEKCRVKLVGAMKSGSTFALYLGSCTIEHADFKTKLCKKDVFPIEIFQTSGERMLIPKREPIYKCLYREEDLEHGIAVLREGFKVVCISSCDPYEYEQLLSDSIPLGYMIPIYVHK
jgi:hypothetical protein